MEKLLYCSIRFESIFMSRLHTNINFSMFRLGSSCICINGIEMLMSLKTTYVLCAKIQYRDSPPMANIFQNVLDFYSYWLWEKNNHVNGRIGHTILQIDQGVTLSGPCSVARAHSIPFHQIGWGFGCLSHAMHYYVMFSLASVSSTEVKLNLVMAILTQLGHKPIDHSVVRTSYFILIREYHHRGAGKWGHSGLVVKMSESKQRGMGSNPAHVRLLSNTLRHVSH